MTAVEKAHLREISTLFLYEKNIIGAQGFQLNEFMRVCIAMQACLAVLELGVNCLPGWKDIVVYPGPFRVSNDAMDAAGVVHREARILSGESWFSGPIVLSWSDVSQEMQDSQAGRNVVIHEIAHKLDALNGVTNGYPPLHYRMSAPDWTKAFSKAYENLIEDLAHRRTSFIDPYAANNPAEFFAVVSEYFFCAPALLYTQFPDVYRQLRLYYRQHPLRRIRGGSEIDREKRLTEQTD